MLEIVVLDYGRIKALNHPGNGEVKRGMVVVVNLIMLSVA